MVTRSAQTFLKSAGCPSQSEGVAFYWNVLSRKAMWQHCVFETGVSSHVCEAPRSSGVLRCVARKMGVGAATSALLSWSPSPNSMTVMELFCGCGWQQRFAALRSTRSHLHCYVQLLPFLWVA